MRSSIGEYTLVAEAYGYYSKEARVNVVEDQTAKSNFILEPKTTRNYYKAGVFGQIL